MRIRLLVAALLFSTASVPLLVRSQGIFNNSGRPVSSSPQDFDLGTDTFSFGFDDIGPIQSSGSLSDPSFGQLTWSAGTPASELFTLGMMQNSFGFQNLSISQIQAITGEPVTNAPLSEFGLVQNLTVQQLTDAIPGLAQQPLSAAPPIQAIAQRQGIPTSGSSTVGSVSSALSGPIGQLGGELVSYGISQIPGLDNLPFNKLPDWANAQIAKIPGLGKIPLYNPLSLKDYFVPFDIGFGMSECKMGWDCTEKDIDNTASGNWKNMSIPCVGGPCSHIEVRRWGPNATDKIRWVSKEQQVDGGSGFLCKKEPTGRFPFGKNPKVVVEKINEQAGEVEFALYFSVEGPFGAESAHCFGPFPMPFFGTRKESELVLFGPDKLSASTTPLAGLLNPAVGPGGGGGGSCAPQENGDKSKERYGHKAHSEANSGDLTAVVTSPSLNRTERLHKDAAAAFNKMRLDAAKSGIDLKVVSGFRSVKDQEVLWVQQVNKQGSEEKAARISAPPGHSEHHTGYALDIGAGDAVNLDASFEKTPAYAWLKDNAKNYGFTQSFNGGANQGADNESWHWRYEGTAAAKAEFSKGSATAAGGGQGEGCGGGASQNAAPVSCDGQPRQFIRPTSGPVTSHFGPRIHPIFRTERFHSGTDFGDPYGTSIRASNCGKVTVAEWTGGYGNYVCIDHGKSVTTCYAHQSEMLVRTGQTVRQGQVIGKVGSTGYSTGPHLHFEFKKSGQFVDPAFYVSGI